MSWLYGQLSEDMQITESCHDANFVVTGGCSAASDDKVGIVKTCCSADPLKLRYKNNIYMEYIPRIMHIIHAL